MKSIILGLKMIILINGFYNQLQLIHQTRRLDYLLINMQGLHKKIEGTIWGGKLAEAILILQRKRNKFVENENFD